MRDTLPVMSGYLVLGIGYGILMEEKGFGAFWSFLAATIVYAGSLQYALIPMLSEGAGLLSVFLTSLAVNIRHLFYGISMAESYQGMRSRGLLAFLLTDETYSLVCDGKKEERYYLAVSLLDWSYWISGCFLGGLIGRVIPFSLEGAEFSLTALFVTVFVEQWMKTEDHRAARIGLCSSAVCLVIFGKSSFLIPSMVLIGICLYWIRGKGESA